MSENLRKKLYIFSVIGKIKNQKLRNAVLQEFIKDDTFYNAMHEVAHNTVKGKLPLTKLQRKKLKGCKKGIYGLSCHKNNKYRKKKAVSELKGGFWTYLIPVVFELLRNI